MANRGYKLQEFLAHSANVNCLSIGKKTSRLLITGGDDYKVNLWSIGKPTSLMSLCGHTSAVDSVAFDSAEVLVLAGASSGVIKLWDLEESKMVRAFTGHRSNCSAVEFHPFGDFLASGSSDTNLKIWDIRKKGCVQSYKGHTRGINTIKFTPDGRWVVSGGLDNVVKVWDLTAGKLLHEFKFHEGPIRSLDFHPLEFLLATGSADRTVKFWDLETFELIGSTRLEATGVRSTTFHPDGRTLFCGLDEGLKVYSWEPVVCHDGVDMGWSTLGDTCISEGKLLGCSYFQSSIGIWVSDISKIEPYGTGSVDKKECMEKILGVLDDQSSNKKMGSSRRSSSPDYETKEIKNIYIDCGNRPLSTRKVNSTSTGLAGDKSFTGHSIVTRDNDIEKESSDSGKESITFSKTKPGMLLRPAHVRKTPTKFYETKQSVVAQLVIPKQSESDGEKDIDTKNVFDSEQSDGKQSDVDDSIIKSITNKFEKALLPEPPSDEAKGMVLKPHRTQRQPSTKSNDARGTKSVDSETLDSQISVLEYSRDVGLPTGLVDNRGSNPCEEDNDHKSISSKSERVPSPEKAGDELKSKESNPVKIVRGVKVVSGRTRSLVERFERGEKVTPSEDKAASATIVQNTNAVQEEPQTTSVEVVSTTPTQVMQVKLDEATNSTIVEAPVVSTRRSRSTSTRVMPVVLNRDTNMTTDELPVTSTRTERGSVKSVITNQATNLTSDKSPARSARQARTSSGPVMPVVLNQTTNLISDEPHVVSTRRSRASSTPVMPVILSQKTNTYDERPVASTRSARRASPSHVISVKLNQTDSMPSDERALSRSARSSPARVIPMKLNQANNVTSDASHITSRQRISPTQRLSTPVALDQVTDMALDEANITPSPPACDISTQKEEPQVSGRENAGDIIETVMKTHDEFLNTLQSRLLKLQIIRHFWERSDIKGAIAALRKLSDHSVQADVISILTDKTEILTLDLFSQLVPVLAGLLGSRTERPVNVSLEMLLKLVAVFGTVIRSTVSAPKCVGVDLHAEERLQICQSCSTELQKVQRMLPLLTRRGGLITRKAQELNLVLQAP